MAGPDAVTCGADSGLLLCAGGMQLGQVGVWPDGTCKVSIQSMPGTSKACIQSHHLRALQSR